MKKSSILNERNIKTVKFLQSMVFVVNKINENTKHNNQEMETIMLNIFNGFPELVEYFHECLTR